MFLGHFAVGLAGKRAASDVSLGAWFAAAQLVDLIWPIFLLLGLEHVRIVPGITAFTPLDFYDYPLTHSLVAGALWAAALAGIWIVGRRPARVAGLIAAAVLSHWVLDVVAHRPDMPVLTGGPYLGLGLWNSIASTLAVELTMFAAGVFVYVRSGAPGARRPAFWLLVGFLLVIYAAVALGPPPPDVRTLAFTGLAAWLLVPWAWWADRRTAR